MAQSKIVRVTGKSAEDVTGGYKKVKDGIAGESVEETKNGWQRNRQSMAER